MARIVVTGANGFIGLALVQALAARGDEVVGFDIVTGPALHALCGRYANVRVVPGDISEWHHVANLLRDARPDAVLHCAAVVGVIACVDAPFATMRVNIGARSICSKPCGCSASGA